MVVYWQTLCPSLRNMLQEKLAYRGLTETHWSSAVSIPYTHVDAYYTTSLVRKKSLILFIGNIVLECGKQNFMLKLYFTWVLLLTIRFLCSQFKENDANKNYYTRNHQEVIMVVISYSQPPLCIAIHVATQPRMRNSYTQSLPFLLQLPSRYLTVYH